LCGGGSFTAAGAIVGANAATYTATIQSQGHTRKVHGPAHVSASFEFRPQHVAAPPTVTLLGLPVTMRIR
jgi:hypothetical protein